MSNARAPRLDHGSVTEERSSVRTRGDSGDGPMVDALLDLQDAAGNAAVASLLQRQNHPAPPGVGGIPHTDAEANAMYQQAVAAYDASDFAQAASLFETLTAAPVTSEAIMPQILHNLALCKLHAGDLDGAFATALAYGNAACVSHEQERQLLEKIETARGGGTPAGPQPVGTP